MPRDTRRFFISDREAAELCLLGALVLPSQRIAVPAARLELPLVPLVGVAAGFLEALGFEAVEFDDEAAAVAACGALAEHGRWPLLLTPLETSGEKAYEQFVGDDDRVEPSGLVSVDAVKPGAISADAIEAFVSAFENLGRDGRRVSKPDFIRLLAAAVPTLAHVETERDLDQRL